VERHGEKMNTTQQRRAYLWITTLVGNNPSTPSRFTYRRTLDRDWAVLRLIEYAPLRRTDPIDWLSVVGLRAGRAGDHARAQEERATASYFVVEWVTNYHPDAYNAQRSYS